MSRSTLPRIASAQVLHRFPQLSVSGVLPVSETGFVSDSSDLPAVRSIEIDVESLRSRGVVFGCVLESFCLPIMPSALMVFIFLVIAVLLLLYAFALGMRTFYAFWAWCVSCTWKVFSRSDGNVRFRPRPSSGLFGMGVVSVRDVVSHCSYL